MFPDTPPTKGYTAITNNSLLEWNLQKDLNQEWLEDVLVTVVQKQSLPNQPKVPKVSMKTHIICVLYLLAHVQSFEVAEPRRSKNY